MPNSSTRKQRTNIEGKNQSTAFSVSSAAFSCHVEVRGFQTESCLEPPFFEAIRKRLAFHSLCVSLQISKKLRPRSVGRKKMQRKLKFVLVIAN